MATLCARENIDSTEESQLLKIEIKDQYGQCDLIERYMENPTRLAEYCPVQLTGPVAKSLVEM